MINKAYKKYRMIVLITSFMAVVASVLSSRSNGYSLVFAVPALYAFLFFFNKSLNTLSQEHKGMLLLNVILFIRYVVSILLMAIIDDYSAQNFYALVPKPESIQLAIFFMLIEMISVFFVITLCGKYFYGGNSGLGKIKNKIAGYWGGSKMVLYVFFAISTVLAFIYRDSFLPGFLDSSNGLVLSEDSPHALSLIFWCFKTILMCLVVDRAICRFKLTNKMIYVVEAYFVTIVYVLLNISASRINLILPLVLLFMITNEIFRVKGKIMLICFSVFILGAVSVITIYKNQYLVSAYSDVRNDGIITMLRGAQEYTSNVRPIAYGIETIDYYDGDITVATFINDIVGSVPVVSHLVDQDDRINHYYNLYALGGKSDSLIMPMVTSSIGYFTPVFSFLMTDVCVLLLMLFDSRRSNKVHTNYLESYMSLYLCLIFAFSVNGNVQIIVGRFFTKYLPVMVVYGLSRIIVLRKRGKDEE